MTQAQSYLIILNIVKDQLVSQTNTISICTKVVIYSAFFAVLRYIDFVNCAILPLKWCCKYNVVFIQKCFIPFYYTVCLNIIKANALIKLIFLPIACTMNKVKSNMTSININKPSIASKSATKGSVLYHHSLRIKIIFYLILVLIVDLLIVD